MAGKTSTLPPVYFNHLYVVLDDKTYRAIQGSDYLQVAFPGKEKRSTLTAAGETWSGTYFYCQDNYLEFFGSGNGPVTGNASQSGHWQAGAQEGWAGLAFSTDQPGGVTAVRQALHDSFGYEPFFELRQVRTGEKTIDWFYHVKLAEPLGLGSFDSWVMEYHPDIFAHKGILLPPGGDLTRQAYLSQWNKPREPVKEKDPVKASGLMAANAGEEPGSAQTPAAPKSESGSRTPARSTRRAFGSVGAAAARPETPPQPVFSRVTGATLHLDAHRAERFARILALLGYANDEQDGALTLSAHGFTLRLLPEDAGPAGYRLSSLRLAMSRPSVAPMTFVFAPGSKLVLNKDMSAVWEFGV